MFLNQPLLSPGELLADRHVVISLMFLQFVLTSLGAYFMYRDQQTHDKNGGEKASLDGDDDDDDKI